MADPKFADLPGIAYDQSDVYETSDLPEADQGNIEVDHLEETDGVEKLNLNAITAHEKFAGKTLDASRTDFSDRIGYKRNTGYESVSGEYTTMDAGSAAETPQQKYLRLNDEMKSLKQDLENAKAQPKGQSDLTSLAKETGELHKQLLDLKLEQVLGTEVMKHINDPQGLLPKKLISDLESFKQARTDSNKSSPGKDAGSKAGEILYELHYQPEMIKFNNSTKIGDLEQRLHILETLVGKDVERSVTLASDTSNRSIMGAIAILNSKLNLLEPTHIDQVDAHLTALSLRLTQLTDKKTQLEEAEKINKISETYQLVKKSETLCVHLPEIVNRMMSLKELHEQALQFSTALTQIDATQQQITVGLKSNQDLLKELQQEFAKNMEIITANVKSLDGRIAALRK